MSAITKVFVVLHVVVSMLLTAGLIVFVNRVEEFHRVNTDLNAKLSAATSRANSAESAVQTAKAAQVAQLTASANEVRAIRSELDTAHGELQKKDADLAGAGAEARSKEAALKSQSDALKVAQDTQGVLQEQIKDLRTRGDKLQEQNTQQSLALSDQQNKLAVLMKQFRTSQEENQSLKEQMVLNGGAPGTSGSTPPNQAGTPPINGVVRATRNIGGIVYATISVGSADSVARGMKFSVLDRDRGQFLGYVTVDTVEPNESTGRVEGPRQADVRPGSEVRTQITGG